jgi:hypothetical protein
MTVNTEDTSRKCPARTGHDELVEFFAQRRASDDRDREIVKPFTKSLRNLYFSRTIRRQLADN